MKDLISRQAVLNLLHALPPEEVTTKAMLIQSVKQMNAAQPDSLVRPSARWMSVGHKSARICSHCFRDEPYKFADHDADIYDFCPHCGAEMEESE